MTLTLDEANRFLNYDPETGFLKWKVNRGGGARAGEVAGGLHPNGYIYVRLCGQAYIAHRLAWLIAYGSWPAGDLDHVNGVGSDNRIANLRPASNIENSRNRRLRRDNLARLKGVTLARENKWRGRIRLNGRLTHLGYFPTKEAAHEAYCEAAKRHFGDFARFS